MASCKLEGALMKVEFLSVMLLSVLPCLAAQFYLQDGHGKEHGPFELRSGAKIRVDGFEATVSRTRPAKEAVFEAMDRIMIPAVDFQNAGIHDVITFLQEASVDYDPQKRGVNIILNLGDTAVPAAAETNAPAAARPGPKVPPVTLKAKEISLLEALKIITNVAGLKYRLEGNVVLVVPWNAPSGPLVRRMYNVLPNFSEMTPSKVSDSERSIEEDWKKFFGELGVPWPEGSSLKYIPSIGKIVIVNTEENMEIFENTLSTLNIMPSQIGIQLQFVSFDAATLPSGPVSQQHLMQLWTNGQGRLLAAPQVITQSGVQATVKGVTECIYPTTYTPRPVTNYSAAAVGAVVAPGNFETRELGAILCVLPEIGPDGLTINVNLTPEYVEEPLWRDFGRMPANEAGEESPIRLEQPYFHTYSISSQVVTTSGKTVIVGGGMPSRDGKSMVYAFLTVRIVGLDGVEVLPGGSWRAVM
jgi:hypothetical protein